MPARLFLSTVLLGIVLARSTPAQSDDQSSLVSTVDRNEQEPRGELDLPRGSSKPVVINSDGSLWIGAQHGHLWVSRDGGRSWAEVETPAEKGKPRSGAGGADLASVSFFTPEIGLLPVSAPEERRGMYRTTDGGATWTRVRLPVGLRCYDIQTDTEGRGWIVGSSGSLLSTDDFGVSWVERSPPFNGIDRSNSVHFVDGTTGIVGSLDDGLAFTSDAGSQWTYLPSPASGLDVEERVRARVRRVLLAGPYLIVQQDVTRSGGEVFYRLLEGVGDWRRLAIGDDPVMSYGIHPSGLAVLTRAGHLAVLDPSLEYERTLLEGLDPNLAPWIGGGVSVGAGNVIVFDGYSHLVIVEGDDVRFQWLETVGEHATWNIRHVDRATDGVLWGVTKRGLYRSEDDGRTWSQATSLRFPGDVSIQRDGNVLLLGGNEPLRWLVDEGRLEAVSEFDGLAYFGLLRRGAWWIANCVRIDEELAKRQAPVGTHSVLAGDWVDGVLLASADGGGTWRVLYEWPGGRIEDMFLGNDDQLAALRAREGIRRGPLEQEDGALHWRSQALPYPENASLENPFSLEWNQSMFFSDTSHGWVEGGEYYGEDKRWSTADGGSTWTLVEQDVPLNSYFRLGGGGYVLLRHDLRLDGITSIWSVGLSRWQNGAFHLVRSFEEEEDVVEARVDAAGGLLVNFPSGDLGRLSADGDTWTLLNERQDRR